MNINPINICPHCVHASYCVLTHTKSLVFSCTEYDELQYKAPVQTQNIKKRKPELETV